MSEADIGKAARHFKSADGWDIWVGRTAADNDILSLRLADPADGWMHVAGQSGSHVIIRPPAAEAAAAAAARPPRETLLDAAHLAIYYSKARAASRAAVHWTRAGQVGKARGAPPGEVTLGRFEWMAIRMDKARLARLVGSGTAPLPR